MLGLFRSLRIGLAVIAAALVFSAASVPARADTGRVHITVTKAGFIVGVGGGSGVLTFKGKRYPLAISGISFGAIIGASENDLIGRAYNMRKASDIVGTYTAIGAGAALAGGGGAVRLQNAKGVVLELKGRKVGVEFSVSLSGMEISMR